MIEVRCISGVELLMDYLEGVLSVEMHDALEEHVAGCDKCAAFVASYCETPRILRDATASALPSDVEQSLKVFLRARTTAFRRH
jgi:anti-sigma factor RsiW